MAVVVVVMRIVVLPVGPWCTVMLSLDFARKKGPGNRRRETAEVFAL